MAPQGNQNGATFDGSAPFPTFFGEPFPQGAPFIFLNMIIKEKTAPLLQKGAIFQNGGDEMVPQGSCFGTLFLVLSMTLKLSVHLCILLKQAVGPTVLGSYQSKNAGVGNNNFSPTV